MPIWCCFSADVWRRVGATIHFFVLLLFLFAVGCTTPAARFAVEFDRTEHDFGKVSADEKLITEFRFTNASRSDVSVRGIRSSCGCVASTTDKKVYQPTEVGLVTVELSTRGISPPARLEKHVLVQFDPPEAGEIRLNVAADLGLGVSVMPARLVFPPGDSPSLELSVLREMLDETDFGNVTVDGDPSVYDVKLLNRQADRIDYMVSLKEKPAAPRLPELFVRRNASIQFGDAVLARVQCERAGPSLLPSTYFVIVEADPASDPDLRKRTEQQFAIQSLAAEELSVVSVECSPPEAKRFVGWELNTSGQGNRFSVWLTAIPESPVVRITLIVYYRSEDGSERGRLMMPCHLVAKGLTQLGAHD